MPNSIIGTTYDLLAFHGTGNDGRFERTFDKVCAFYFLEIDDQDKKKYRKWAYHFLRTVGYLELVRNVGQWSVAPPTLVQVTNSHFTLLGGSREKERLEAATSKKAVREILSDYSNQLFPRDVSFFPSTVSLEATRPEVLRLSNKTGLHVSFDYQDKIFRYLPGINSVLTTVLSEVTHRPIFEPNSGRIFDLQTREWLPHTELHPQSAGLYRSDLQFALTKYYLVNSVDERLKTYLFKDREWALVCFLALSDLKLPLQYNVLTRTLSIQISGYGELRLPTLLERCLRSGTLTSPKLNGKWTSYENINYANVWHLLAKLPIFTVEIK
jgi:hypothetical protein